MPSKPLFIRKRWLALCVLGTLAAGNLVYHTYVSLHAPTHPSSGMDTATLSVNDITFRVELARTLEQQRTGLMHRTSLLDDHGMLFIYPEPKAYCFWMKNTHIPLTAAFLDESGRILQTEDMQPHTRNTHCSAQPVRHALEMAQGWFDDKNIQIGDRITSLPSR